MKITTAGRNAACAALIALFDAATDPGYLEVRSGTPPTSAEDAASGSVLVTFTLPKPAFDTAGALHPGEADAFTIDTAMGDNGGTATWFRAYDGDGNAVEDGTVSNNSGSEELKLNTATITVGMDVSVSSWSITFPEA